MPNGESPPQPKKCGRRLKSHCKRGHDMSVTRRKSPGRSSSYCSACAKVGDFPSWRPSKKREYGLMRAYGITIGEWGSILASQGGRCAICRTDDFGKKGPTVDHCHETGVVRGILCTPCNTSIGQIRENADIARAMADYIELHRAKRPA